MFCIFYKYLKKINFLIKNGYKIKLPKLKKNINFNFNLK